VLVLSKNNSIVRNSRKISSVNLKEVKFSRGPVHNSELGKLTENKENKCNKNTNLPLSFQGRPSAYYSFP